HGTGFGRHTVEQHRTGAAMGGVAADVRAGQAKDLADQVHQQQPRFDLRFEARAVHGHADLVGRHGYCPPAARCAALVSARCVSTRAMFCLYSTVPRRSGLGDVAAAARFAASANVAASGFFPFKNCSASVALIGVGPRLVRPMPAASITPPPMTRNAAAPAVAKSPTLRSSLTYAPPLPG